MDAHNATRPLDKGQRVFTCGHSFHAFVAGILVDLAKAAGIAGHRAVGTSMIGASRAIQHWNVPEEQNQANRALRAGEVDVLTLSCMAGPDEGIREFAKLAVAHNPDVRVTLQELWLPEDRFPFDPANRTRQSVEQFNESTMHDLVRQHEAYFRVMEDYVTALNADMGKDVVFIVPDAQATLALRERIIGGTAPGLTRQSDLFTDAWGHPSEPLQRLSGYCHFSVIYRRSPVGLPLPSVPETNPPFGDALSRLLQELAWHAVVEHPLSGVRTVAASRCGPRQLGS
jgi:hypothetical protein